MHFIARVKAALGHFRPDEARSKSRHFGYAPKSGSKIGLLATVMTDPGGFMMPTGA